MENINYTKKHAFQKTKAFDKTDLHTPGFWSETEKYRTSVRKDNGLPGWLDKIRGLGNAVVPDIVEAILDSINES